MRARVVSLIVRATALGRLVVHMSSRRPCTCRLIIRAARVWPLPARARGPPPAPARPPHADDDAERKNTNEHSKKMQMITPKFMKKNAN
jgi:hypothetical protein